MMLKEVGEVGGELYLKAIGERSFKYLFVFGTE